MKRAAIAVLVTLTLSIPPALAGTGAPGVPELDPEPSSQDAFTEVSASPNMRFVENFPYVAPPTASSGTDIEFGEFTVTVLDENGDPVCETDAEGNCLVDEEGNIVYKTEQRDYAFAGSQNRGIHIFDITDPENAFRATAIPCNVNQADIQVRVDLGLLGVGVDTNTSQCGLAATQGVLLFDVSDPRFPEQVGVYPHTRGAHNLTFHPTQPLMYLSDSDVANAGLGEIPIVDISDPASPTLVTTFRSHAHSPHDITFNATGTRAYTSSISHSDILDTTDPRNPALISTIHDPTINIHHQSDPTPDGRFLIISDELAGAAAGPQCPGGGLHYYDITNEMQPRKAGVFFAQVTEALQALCTAHVFRINPDGKSLTIGWYSGGTRIVDISDPTALGAVEVAHMIPSGLGGNPLGANSWASKQYKGYIYSNDRNRGLDIMQYLPGTPDAAEGADAVVGVVDTGINPYHDVFADPSPRAFQHPSTYIEGYPEDAIALNLTLDEPDYWAAVRADCQKWAAVQNGKLYWIPGTKIVGAISFGNIAGISCGSGQPPGGKILDTGGHGTMTASRATSTVYGACRQCRVVAIQFPTSINLVNPGPSTAPAVQAIRFAADNASWIDAQSNSWGPFLPAWEPTGAAGLLVANPALVQAVDETSRAHAAFWASGNGAAFRFGVAGHPTLLAPHMTPEAIIVGGMDSGYINTWPGFPPHVISDSCDSWAAQHRTTTGSNGSVGGGTSGATPFAAGGAARILLEARSILSDTDTGVDVNGVVAQGPAGLVPSGPIADGELTLAEWKNLVFKTATPRPVRQFEDGNVCDQPLDAPYNTTPVKWASLPKDVPAVLYIGYGAVDDEAQRRAFQVLAGERMMPVRTVEDAYFTADKATREALLNVWQGVG